MARVLLPERYAVICDVCKQKLPRNHAVPYGDDFDGANDAAIQQGWEVLKRGGNLKHVLHFCLDCRGRDVNA